MLIRIVTLSLLVLLGSCSFLQRDVTASVGSGGKYCGFVATPEPWNAGYDVPFGWRYLYRISSNPSELLFTIEIPGAESRHMGSWPADTKYLVDLDRRGSIRRATDAEWGSAHEIPSGGEIWVPERDVDRFRGPNPGGDFSVDKRVIIVQGHELRKSGDIWWAVQFSPGDRYVALVSFDGYRATGKTLSDGAFYLDIYDTASGRLLAKISGNSHPYVLDPVLGEIRWVSNRDLVMSIDTNKRKLLTCRFDK